MVWKKASIACLLVALFLSGFASATVDFQVSDDPDISYEDFDIVAAGGYQSNNSVVFWMEVRGTINLNPPDGYLYGYFVNVHTISDHTIDLSLYATNSGGSTTLIATMAVDGSDITFLDETAYSISGNRLYFYVDGIIGGVSDGVDTVEFYTSRTSGILPGTAVDSVTYSASTTTSGTTSDGTETGGESMGMDWLPFMAVAGIMCLCYALPFIISLILAIWVYKDAKRRGDDRAPLWFVLVFFLPILGLIIYLVLRKEETPPPPPPPPQPPQPPQPQQ